MWQDGSLLLLQYLEEPELMKLHMLLIHILIREGGKTNATSFFFYDAYKTGWLLLCVH
jgi:hypothetical protein